MEAMGSTQARQYEAEAAIGAGMDENQMDEHMKAMWAGQSNILVSVRVRPIMKHDVVKKSCVRVLDGKVVVIMDPAQNDAKNVLRSNRTREKQYAFDYVFEPSSSQEATYHHTTKFLIHGVLDGFNATVFAYGQTGSGKTYTMIGTEENPGIMVRVMSDLFSICATQAAANVLTYKVTVSFLEVYNENIRDLLSEGVGMDEYLDLREDPIKGPVVAGITEVEAKTSGEIMRLLHQGNARRSQAATAANEVSSRSHAVLQVIIEARDSASGHGVVDNIKVGKLSLVDLAGSERAANTQNRGARLVEGANINRSLLALGNCINALGEKGNKGNFVPYRDSKLTRLLKDSLGGNCRTVMIANISAAESSFEETLNTLKYANRAKNIKTEAKRNVLNVNYHISEYVELINNLRGEIKQLKDQIEVGPGAAENGNLAAGPNGNDMILDSQAAGEVNAKMGLEQPTGAAGGGPHPGGHSPHEARVINPSTPMQAVRDSLRSGGSLLGGRNTSAQGGETRELVNSMRQMIVSNFQERMQLRRSLIELEDQNVQNSIEVSKRQLMVVQWTEKSGMTEELGDDVDLTNSDLSAAIIARAPQDVATAWRECEQIRKAVAKNNSMKRSIAKRLRHNEREAERVRDEMGDKITGEDRRQLMELQYQVGRLELENMELEQHRIVHESILKGKDLVIQKLKLQLAVKEKVISRQESVLKEHNLNDKVGYSQLAMFERSLAGDLEAGSPGVQIGANTALYATQSGIPESSPPRPMGALGVGTYVGGMPKANNGTNANPKQQRHPKVPLLPTDSASLDGNSDEDVGNNSSTEYADFTVEDPRRANKSGEADFERREKERLSKERENVTMQQKKKEMMERQQQMQRKAQAAREPPSSHHFLAANNSGGGGAGPDRQQGAVIKKGSMVRRPRPNPNANANAKTSPRRGQIDREAQEKEQQFQKMGVQGHGSGGMPGGSGSSNSSMSSIPPSAAGSNNSSGSNLLGPGPGGRGGPRRPQNGYVPSSWESKESDAMVHQQKQQRAHQLQMQHQQQEEQSRDHQNMSPIGADDLKMMKPTVPSNIASSSSMSGGNKKASSSSAYPNLYHSSNQPPSSVPGARVNVSRNVQGGDEPPVIPQQHSIISSDGYAEGTVYHSSPNKQPSYATGSDGEERSSGMRKRRPMGAAGARPKRGGRGGEGGGDSLDEGSVETVYSEDDRSLESNGPGGEGKQHSPQAAAAARAHAMQERDQMRQQMREDDSKKHNQLPGQVAPIMTSADRAYAAAQAQVEAHRKQAAAQQQVNEQQQAMVKGAGKMRARPRIRNLSNDGQGRQQPNPGNLTQDKKDQDVQAYESIIAQGSVSRVQQRAEGPSASLDRVRGLEAGGNKNISPQQSGLGGMNRPNQPTRSRPQQNAGPRMRKSPMSPDGIHGHAAEPFPTVNNSKDALSGLKKLYRAGNH